MNASGSDAPSVAVQAGRLGVTVPAWLLRAGLALALAGAGGCVMAWTSPPGIMPVLLVASGAGSAIWPQSHAPGIYLGCAALTVLLDTDAEVTGWTFAAVFALHATHQLAALAALTPWRATVEREALRPALRRFLLVQGACQPLVLLSYLLTTSA